MFGSMFTWHLPFASWKYSQRAPSLFAISLHHAWVESESVLGAEEHFRYCLGMVFSDSFPIWLDFEWSSSLVGYVIDPSFLTNQAAYTSQIQEDKWQEGAYYMLLHPLEGSMTFIAQDPCRAPRGRRPRGVGGRYQRQEGDTSDGRAIPAMGGRYQRREGDTTCTPLREQ